MFHSKSYSFSIIFYDNIEKIVFFTAVLCKKKTFEIFFDYCFNIQVNIITKINSHQLFKILNKITCRQPLYWYLNFKYSLIYTQLINMSITQVFKLLFRVMHALNKRQRYKVQKVLLYYIFYHTLTLLIKVLYLKKSKFLLFPKLIIH